MTIQHISFYTVQSELAKILSLGHDPEAAHGVEDALHLRVLKTIADGATDDPAKLAAEAFKTHGLTYERWYA